MTTSKMKKWKEKYPDHYREYKKRQREHEVAGKTIKNSAGRERQLEMIDLRNGGMTIQEIANKHGISRQRVQQIMGSTGKNFLSIRTNKIAETTDVTNMTYQEIIQQPGTKKVWIRKAAGNHHATNKVGDKEERIASKLMQEYEIPNTLSKLRCPYDILTDSGKRIDVKHTNYNITDACISQKCVSPSYRISHMKRGKDCDFFFCMVPDQSEKTGYANFIIPANAISTPEIRIIWPHLGRKPSKWEQYKDRYDLLQN